MLRPLTVPSRASSLRASSSLAALCALLLGGGVLAGLPMRAQESQPTESQPADGPTADGQTAASESEREPETGSEIYTSYISEVDACNRAQKLRPAEAIVTRMHYWREGDPGERRVVCRIHWSQRDDAQPTRRPILFGPSA